MTLDENKELARHYYDAGDRNALEEWDEICSAEMTLIPGFAPPVCGLEAVKQFTAVFHNALSDLYLTVHDVVAEGDTVAVRWTEGGTHTGPLPSPTGEVIPPTGRTMVLRGVSVVRIAGGEIVEERVQADIFGAMQSLGLIPDQAAPVTT